MNNFIKFKSLFLWALLPIICFALALPLTNLYCNLTDYNFDYNDLSASRLLQASEDIKYQSPTEISEFGSGFQNSLLDSHIEVAQINNLFPDFNTGKIFLFHKINESDYDYVRIWTNNGSLIEGVLEMPKYKEFRIKFDENNETKYLNLGKYNGKLNSVFKGQIDRNATLLNVVFIVTLLLSLIGYTLIKTRDLHLTEKIEWIKYIPVWCVALSLASLSLKWFHLWIFDSRYEPFYPEIIALAWAVSEASILCGLIYLYIGIESKLNIFELNKEKYHYFPLNQPSGNWQEEGYSDENKLDSIIIDKDGFLIYIPNEGNPQKMMLSFSENSIIASDENGILHIIKHDGHSSYSNYGPAERIIFKEKIFTRGGIKYDDLLDINLRRNTESNTFHKVLAYFFIPKETGSWPGLLFSLAVFICAGYGLIKDNSGEISPKIFMCGIILVSLFYLLKNLYKFLTRKRFKKIQSIFDKIYFHNINSDELCQYIKAALKNDKLSFDEWKKNNI